mmetsp:Transcript_42557/g.138719  ORF Transcript_42557/g.138719 Transcript_42557/m.138719 type:complete len:436 (+) Transcript_42557:294-1601(+)
MRRIEESPKGHLLLRRVILRHPHGHALPQLLLALRRGASHPGAARPAARVRVAALRHDVLGRRDEAPRRRRVAAQHVHLLRRPVHGVEALRERVDGTLQPRRPHLRGRLRRQGGLRVRRQLRARAVEPLPGEHVEREADARLVVGYLVRVLRLDAQPLLGDAQPAAVAVRIVEADLGEPDPRLPDGNLDEAPLARRVAEQRRHRRSRPQDEHERAAQLPVLAGDAERCGEPVGHGGHLGAGADLAEGELEVEAAEARRHRRRVLDHRVVGAVLCGQVDGARHRKDEPAEPRADDAARQQVVSHARWRALGVELVLTLQRRVLPQPCRRHRRQPAHPPRAAAADCHGAQQQLGARGANVDGEHELLRLGCVLLLLCSAAQRALQRVVQPLRAERRGSLARRLGQPQRGEEQARAEPAAAKEAAKTASLRADRGEDG